MLYRNLRLLGSIVCLLSANAMAAPLCHFTPPPTAKLTLFQAFAKTYQTYGSSPDVEMMLIGCRNAEFAPKDTTYGLMAKHGIPESRDGVTILFVFFDRFQDGKYWFSLDTSDDPWMDGYSSVDASTGAVEPTYP